MKGESLDSVQKLFPGNFFMFVPPYYGEEAVGSIIIPDQQCHVLALTQLLLSGLI